VTRDRDTEVWRTKDDRLWRIGGDAEIAWIQENTESGRAITSAIPPIFAAYATLELPGTGDHDAASLDGCEGEGKGCPPEDCGGSWGYADLKESLADPSHEAHEDMLEWLGLDNAVDFDPTACNVAEINDVLRMTIASRSARASAW
jgi:Plasmid pRiA4b ORF-3-like protein